MAELLTPPDWLLNDMVTLSTIEPQLYPTISDIAQFHHWLPVRSEATAIILEVSRRLQQFQPSIIFLAPWVKRGGADLELLHFVEAVNQTGVSCAVITSLKDPSPWLSRLPKNVLAIELGDIIDPLVHNDKITVLAQIILNSSAKAIHIMNCPIGWEIVNAHGAALKHVSLKIFASLYCDDVSPVGGAVGYASDSFSNCCQWISSVTTDNKHFAHSLHYREGYPLSKLFPIYYPAPFLCPPKLFLEERTENPNILWASRMTWGQKTPQILLEIVCSTPELIFHIYGEPDDSVPSEFVRKLKSQKNCIYHGCYDRFSDLCSPGRFGAFLYTSGWDGLPNVLLEAAGHGLPIVAPDIGGISELVYEETGYLVSDFCSSAEYRSKLLQAVKEVEASGRKAENAWNLLRKRHCQEEFISSIKNIPEYPISQK